eukprot:TRINITY_DN85894_c0_g1_i1.p1 TRINITY_DN85894_c0_g1~~TRINITY_DN85894_c0_g1_i1.p1  ORF type:complete len:113 (+),score=0.02 TRINITY_DN85894_c0_g1_i1:33-341(+)
MAAVSGPGLGMGPGSKPMQVPFGPAVGGPPSFISAVGLKPDEKLCHEAITSNGAQQLNDFLSTGDSGFTWTGKHGSCHANGFCKQGEFTPSMTTWLEGGCMW